MRTSSRLALGAVVACGLWSCDPQPPCRASAPGDSPYAIHDGEPHPACEVIPGRTDLVAPETVDTVEWGAPQRVGAPVNDDCPDDDAEISADGQTLYFFWSPQYGASNAELLQGTTGVYAAPRAGGPGEFGTPRFLDLRKGTSGGAADGHPRIGPRGDRVYFHSVRADNTGYRQNPPVDDPLDVYMARMTGDVACAAENLGPAVNSVQMDGEPGVSPDGSTLYFASGRPGGSGGDIYFSTAASGSWSAAVNLGAPVNSSASEGQVAFAASDPDTMYFTSDRDNLGAAIYRSRRVGGAWQAPELVIRGQVGSPSLTADGSTLYFVHVLTDNTPGAPVFDADIYYVQHR